MTSPRLLLVDDDPDLGVIVRVLARRGGYALRRQGDVESALAALAAEPFDLILLDINLPGFSGIDLLHRLRATPTLAAQPVALFCQRTLVEDIAAGWSAGADYLVSKELVTQPEEWKQRLDEIVAHPRGRASESSLFIPKGDCLGNLETLARLRALPIFQGMSATLLGAIARRACQASFGHEEPVVIQTWMEGVDTQEEWSRLVSPEQNRQWVGSLFDQIGCLFGQAECEKMLAGIRNEPHGS